LRAADLILTHATKGVEVMDLAEQVQQLRQEIDALVAERRRPR
jgi:hypothetical protein